MEDGSRASSSSSSIPSRGARRTGETDGDSPASRWRPGRRPRLRPVGCRGRRPGDAHASAPGAPRPAQVRPREAEATSATDRALQGPLREALPGGERVRDRLPLSPGTHAAPALTESQAPSDPAGWLLPRLALLEHSGRRPHLRTQPAEPDAARRCPENAEAPARPPAKPRPRATGAGRESLTANLRLDSPTVRTRISIGWRWRGAGLAEAGPVEGARIGALVGLDPPP